MSARVRISLVLLVLLWVVGVAGQAGAQSFLDDYRKSLVYLPITACRIVDTRVHGDYLLAGDTRSFRSSPNGNPFFNQGGANGNCGLGQDIPRAVVLTITAVSPNRTGYATVYRAGSERPLAASLTFMPGVVVSNTVILSMAEDDAHPPTIGFSLYSSAQADFVIDLIGIFAPGQLKPVPCFRGQAQTVTVAPRSEGTVSATCNFPWPFMDLLTQVTVACSQVEPSPRTLALTETGFSCSAFNFGPESRTLSAQAQCCYTTAAPSAWLLDRPAVPPAASDQR